MSKINGRVIVLSTIAAIILSGIVYISSKQYKAIDKSFYSVQHTHEVLVACEKLSTLFLSYNNHLPFKASSANYNNQAQAQSVQNIYSQYNLLKRLTSENADHQTRILDLKKIIDSKKFAASAAAGNSIFESTEKEFLLTQDSLTNEKFIQAIAAIKKAENAYLITRKAYYQTTIDNIRLISFLLRFIILVLTVIIIIKIQRESFKKQTSTLLENHATLIDLSNDAIISVDANFVIMMWNQGAENFYGFTKKEAIGKPIFNFVKTKVRDEKMAEMVSSLKATGSWHGELIQYNKQGEEIHALVSYSSIQNPDGSIKAYTSTRADITKQKHLEAELRQLNADLEKKVNEKTNEVKEVFERMQKAFIAFDNDWKCTYANNTVLTYLKTSKEDISGKSFSKLFTGIEQTEFYKASQIAMATQQTVTIREYIRFFDCWYESSIYPSKDGVSIYVSDVTKEKKDEEELEKNNRLLRVLSSHIENLREEERKAIARELHDDMGQVAAVLKIDINRLKAHLLKNGFNEEKRLADIIMVVDTLMRKIKKLSHELRPDILDNIGLQSALAKHCNDFEVATGITCSYINELRDTRLSQQLETTFFRICQEALTNVMRHAEATETVVHLYEEDGLVSLAIQDNGKGFNVNLLTHSLGLVSMKERAKSVNGTLNITSSATEGSTVCISVKIKDNKAITTGIA